jgi:hypothetical protein
MTITTDSSLYQKAFVRYLRQGIPLELSIKALLQAETAEHHTTTHYIWRTAGDNKVRASHAANAGRIFAWNNPPPTGHPGQAPNCRCTAEPYHGPGPYEGPYDPPIEPVYPELYLISFLRVPKLIALWRAWWLSRSSSREWQLSSDKSPEKWANQMRQGGWTPEKITAVIRNGTRHRAINKKTNGPATRYQLGDDFVVKDDTTNDIIQVSRPNMKPEVFD